MPRHAHLIQHFHGPFFCRHPVPAKQAEGHVVQYGKMREQRIVLKHIANAPLLGRHVNGCVGHDLFIDDDTARLQPLHAGGDAQQCCLAATRWTQQTDQLAGGNRKGNIV